MSSILVVDDERGIRALCSDVLGRAGYEVEAVDSAAGAVAAVARRRFDLILCDINLPDQSAAMEVCEVAVERPDRGRLVSVVHDDKRVITGGRV